MGSEEWLSTRLGKFTASKMYLLMGERGIGDSGIGYIRSRIGEELTGKSSDNFFGNEYTAHGNVNEKPAIFKFGEFKNIVFLNTQVLIHEQGTRFSCTPDFIWTISESTCELKYEVSVGEVKCYPTFEKFVACAECSTPEEIKKVDPSAYWQLITQMDLCDALRGYLVYYHPDFKVGGFRVIEFRKKNLIKEFELLINRKEQALNIFNEKRELLMNIKN